MYTKKFLIGYTLIVAGVVTLLCTAMFVLFGYNFMLKSGIEVENGQAAETAATVTRTVKTRTNQSNEKNTIETEKDQTKEKTDTIQESITIPGFEKWTLEADNITVTSDFYNPEDNNCYFVLTVKLKSSGKVIYQSKYLKPGQHLYQVDLKEPLAAGTYDAVLHYDTYSLDDNTPMNGANVPFTLIAQ